MFLQKQQEMFVNYKQQQGTQIKKSQQASLAFAKRKQLNGNTTVTKTATSPYDPSSRNMYVIPQTEVKKLQNNSLFVPILGNHFADQPLSSQKIVKKKISRRERHYANSKQGFEQTASNSISVLKDQQNSLQNIELKKKPLTAAGKGRRKAKHNFEEAAPRNGSRRPITSSMNVAQNQNPEVNNHFKIDLKYQQSIKNLGKNNIRINVKKKRVQRKSVEEKSNHSKHKGFGFEAMEFEIDKSSLN